MTPIADVLICLRFFSRIPLPATAREITLGAAGFSVAAAATPVAGALLGLVPAAMLAACVGVGLPPGVAAGFALAAAVAVTGALHEDALADCADGFGGGRDRASKLAIMRDSRIGAFGGCAIALSLYLRLAAIQALLSRFGLPSAAMALVAVSAWSRALCLLPLVLLAPARADGLGVAVATMSSRTVGTALGGGFLIAAGSLVFAHGSGLAALCSLLAPAIVVLGVCRLARRQIGGHTGDVSGAAQQVAEIVALACCSAR